MTALADMLRELPCPLCEFLFLRLPWNYSKELLCYP